MTSGNVIWLVRADDPALTRIVTALP